MAQEQKLKVKQFIFNDYNELNSRIFEVYSAFRADFVNALKERQVIKLKAIAGKEIGLEFITLASQIFNLENKKLGIEKQIYILPLEKEDNKYKKSDIKSVELTGKLQKFTCFEIDALMSEQLEVEKLILPSKLQKRFVKSTDKTQAEPAADKSSVEPASSDRLEASDDLLFELSDLIVARFKIDNKNRTTIESAMASILERYSIQKKN